MAFKLKTAQRTEEIFNRIEASENLSWPTLIRLALALSIRQGTLLPLEFGTDNLGRELNRQTVTSDEDAMFKCLIQLQEKRHISDEEYFPDFVKAHLFNLQLHDLAELLQAQTEFYSGYENTHDAALK